MSYTWHKSKIYLNKLKDIDKQIKELQDQLYYCDDTEKYKKLLILKSEYNELTANTIATSLMWLKQSYYDQGEKEEA